MIQKNNTERDKRGSFLQKSTLLSYHDKKKHYSVDKYAQILHNKFKIL